MHDSDSFITEVSEAVRRDKLFGTLRRYAWLIAAAVVLIVGGAAFHEWQKVRGAATAAAAGDALKAAMSEPDAATRAGALGDFAAARPHAAVVAKLAQAGSLRDSGDAKGAAAILDAVAGDGAVPELYRSLAALERVMVLGSDMDPTERAATLETLVAPGGAFRPLALEQRALMRLEANDKPGAIADLQAVLSEPAATEALAGRARQLLIAAGGTLPGDALPGSPSSAAPTAGAAGPATAVPVDG